MASRMPPPETPKQRNKRTRDGKQKARDNVISTSQAQRTPTCAQPPPKSTSSVSATQSTDQTSEAQNQPPIPTSIPAQLPRNKRQPKPNAPSRHQKQKLPKLPDNVTISKRPIFHPAIPTPHSSAASPKTVYITASSPFIPAVKRVRTLLSHIAKRAAQSEQATLSNLRSNGRLTNRAVERAIAETAERDGKGTTKEVEWVYVKATGRAIPRALEIGCYFQGQADCRVRVEIGSVCAIDDIEIKPDAEKAVQKEEQERGEGMDTGDVAMTDADDDNGEQRKGEGGRKKRKKQVVAEEDVPETRLRNLSAVTVSICLK